MSLYRSLRPRWNPMVFSLAAVLLLAGRPAWADHFTSKMFQGVKANTGTVTYHEENGQRTLRLSDDFKIPDAPAPHWQLVDSLGNTYLLERLKIKDDKVNQKITVPAYVPDIAKVQIWCAWAETLLGETTFENVIKGNRTESASLSSHISGPFKGVKANTGTVSHSKQGGQSVLTLSDDFKVPDSPAPHWQIVDSNGKVYLLQRLVIKGDKFHKRITVPAFIPDIAKVQIWCAWAEVLLGEASFDRPVK